MVYHFLLGPYHTPLSNIIGLYFSCKLICNEIHYELPTAAFLAMQAAISKTHRISRPVRSSSCLFLTRISLGVPRRLLEPSADVWLQWTWLVALRPAFALRLRQLVLYIGEDPETQTTVGTFRRQAQMYDKRTTRANVGPLAMRITCMVCPEICCLSEHNNWNESFCMLQKPAYACEWVPWRINVQSVSLYIKTLDPLPIAPPPASYLNILATPDADRMALRHYNWHISGTDGFDELHGSWQSHFEIN